MKITKLVPSLILFILIISTLAIWQITLLFAQRESSRIFLQEADLIRTGVEHRLNTQLLVSESFAGLMGGSDRVSRAEWSRAIKRVDLRTKYSGLSSVNYVERVFNSNKQAFISELRADQTLSAEERSQLTIFPDGVRDEYYVVKYIEPLEGRLNAIGYDLGSDNQRLEAVQKAIYSAHPASTGKIDLVTTNQAGFGLLTPVYDQPIDEDTPDEDRKASLKGFIYLVFRGDDIFREVFGEQSLLNDLDIEIYASAPADPDQLLFDSWPEGNVLSDRESLPMMVEKEVRVNGNYWTLLVGTQKNYHLLPSQIILPWVVLGAGLVITAIYAFVYWRLIKNNYQTNHNASSESR
jgi:CHASE1-domain containing sensor protein